ncbi:MAG: M42 family metallopeptidase [Asgard group archaeon]|nr:M42 family metallopeptidase [Asgard group archaeon]
MKKLELNIEQFEKWTNAFGPSGFESEVAKMVKDYVSQFADEVTNDKTGSLIFKKGTKGPKIMLAGHIDEIGFIVAGITKDGFITFNQLGGWWDQTLLSQKVIIRNRDNEKFTGVIVAKPPHILSKDERGKVVKKENMFIDIGCKNKKEVEALNIKIGDPIMPDSYFKLLKRTQIRKKNNNDKEEEKEVTLAMGKAFDDRAGAFVMAEVLRRLQEENIEHPNQIYGVATVQEEVGLRGARTAAQLIKPDVGFALDVDISGDIPGVSKTKTPSEMSKGPALLTADSSMLPNPKLKHFVMDIAEETGVDFQLSILARGGTDAGVIHLTGIGCPSLAINISTRHIHSHNSILDINDIQQTVDLLVEIVKRLDKKTVESFTAI